MNAAATKKGKSVFDMLDSMSSSDSNATSLSVKVLDLAPDPDQPRKVFTEENLENLAESIREVGIIEPIVVQPTGGVPPYKIIAGERRWRAAQRAGLDEVPIVVREDLAEDNDKRELVQLIENANREDLTDYELAQAIQARLDRTPKAAGAKGKLAALMNMPAARMSRLLAMLDAEWRPFVEEGVIVKADALARFRGADQEVREALIEAARESGEAISVSAVLEAKAKVVEPAAQAPAPVTGVGSQEAATNAADTETEQSALGGGDGDAGEHGDNGAIVGEAGSSTDDALAAGGMGFDGLANVGTGSGSGDDDGNDDDSDDDEHAGNVGTASSSTTTGSSSSNSGASSGSTRAQAVSMKLTGEGVEAMLRYLVDKSTDRLEVRIPADLAIAVIENLDGTLPDSPEHYAQTIKDLLDAKLGS